MVLDVSYIYDIYVNVSVNVNPGLINSKRLLNWEGTIKKYQMK